MLSQYLIILTHHISIQHMYKKGFVSLVNHISMRVFELISGKKWGFHPIRYYSNSFDKKKKKLLNYTLKSISKAIFSSFQIL